MPHEARQVPSWLILNVRQKKHLPRHIRITMNAAIPGASVVLCALIVSSCGQPEQRLASHHEAERIRVRFTQVLTDFSAATTPAVAADAYLSAHTKDALLMFSGAEAVQGHAAIRPLIVDFAKAYKFTLSDWKSEELIVSGDLAIHRFSDTAVMTPRIEGNVIRERRKYLDVWRKGGDGEWRIALHIYNRND
jgi:ketosteroid isomerase-like protein